MNKSLHRALHGAKRLTLAQLRVQHPELAAEVVALVRRAEQTRLNAALTGLPAHVRAKVVEIDLATASGDVIEHLRMRLVELGVEATYVNAVVERAHKAKVGQELAPGQVIGTDPAVARQLAAGRVHEVIAIAGLDTAAADAVANAAPATSALGDATLSTLVSQHALTEAQAKAVGFSAALYEIVGADAALASAIRAARLGGNPAASTRDLARWSPADWTGFLEAANVALPTGTTPTSMGKALAGRLSVLHPGVAFTARLPEVDVANLAPLASAYPGLGLAAVLTDQTQSSQVKASTVARRVGFVRQVSERLGETLVLGLDLSANSADLTRLGLDSLGATPDEQRMVVATFQAYQRAWALTNDIDDTQALVRAGFTSGLAIARQSSESFQAMSGFDAATARGIWDAARTAMADVSLTATSILDVMHGMFDRLAVGNLTPSAVTYLAKLPGFEDLFGSLSFCDCEECRSILGPAAYFVDLMKYIDENLRPQFATHPGHPLDLKTRRPDLWTLELSCDNTDHRIATLDILAEILENYIAQDGGFTEPLTDRAKVGTQVYEKTLAGVVDSFRQPFHLPLARIASYLTELGTRRAAIAEAVAAPSTTRAQAELGLSAGELPLVTKPDADVTHMSHVYGVSFDGTAAAIDPVDAQVLGPAMGLTRDELGALVGVAFVAAGGARVTVTAAKRDAASVQNDVEWVEGLTADALDRMHRFTRMVRKVGWSIAELDVGLATLGDTTLGTAAVEAIAGLHAIKTRLGGTVAEVCALVGAIPQAPAGASLFDRLFNAPSFVAADGRFPLTPAPRFIHPGLRETTTALADPALPRLLAGLATDLDGLLALVRHLAPHLAQETSPGFDPAAKLDDDRYFVLSAANLTLLYRHARLSRLLGIAIDELFQLLGFLGLDRVAGLPDVLALLELDVWRRHSGYRLDDIAVATGQAPRDPTGYLDPAAVAKDVATSAATQLAFTDTIFAVALGMTEQGSRDLLDANHPAVVEKLATGGWRLTAGIDLDAVAIVVPKTAIVPTPPSGTRLVTVGEVRGALRAYLVRDVLARSLGAALGVAVDKIVALVALAGQSFTVDAVVKAVRGDGPLAPLTALVAAVRPFAVALTASVWDAAAIDFLRLHHELFGAEDLPHTVADALHPSVPFVSLAQLRALSTYTRLAPTDAAISAEDLRGALIAFDATTGAFPPSADAAIARVLGVPSGLVAGLRGHVTLPKVAAGALDQLDRATTLAVTLGVDGETFGSLVSDDYAALSHAADALVAALAARNPDEASRIAKLDEAEQPVREAKRDALTDYLIHSVTPTHWHTLDELYEYFLIDVEAGGCSTTSRLVSATMSAQLYVHRAIMHLEQDHLPATDPKHVDVGFKPKDPVTGDDPAAEWSWRKNYRVWQANRKVFLWPENYLDPDLRDDKTPLFKELEQELLQTDITDQNVLDAYTKYLTGFEEIGSLVIAGAYHDVRTTTKVLPGQVGDVLHLFGATAGDPPTYYYRTCENLIASGRNPSIAPVWSAWQKIGVQITGRKVSPIVHLGRLHVFWIDIKTRPMNELKDGGSTFAGYRHKMSLKFTTLRPDGTWTAPQEVELPGYVEASGKRYYDELGPAHGQVTDRVVADVPALDPDRRVHKEAIDDYTLFGPNWDWGWLRSIPAKPPNAPALQLRFRNFLHYAEVDLFSRKTTLLYTWDYPGDPYPQLLCAKTGASQKHLWCGTSPFMFWQSAGFANAVIDEERIAGIGLETSLKFREDLERGLDVEEIATLPPETQLLAIPGSEKDVLLQIGNDILLLQGSFHDDGGYVLRRLGSTLVETSARRLFESGIDELLDIKTQLRLAEAELPFTLVGGRITTDLFNGPVAGRAGTLDFNGPCGAYYRELFFHIPFLIANALNARGRFESAQRWYHYIFDPTAAAEKLDLSGLTPSERAHRLLDRVWRYSEFRGQNIEHLHAILTDKTAIALYKRDPFNPWAIARRRISAFQKAMVMKYVDNLIDWGDSLFTQFTMESVNEAMMLYIMASDVLGPRPARLGDCGDGVEPNTYAEIAPLVDGAHEILGELETLIVGHRSSAMPSTASVSSKYAIPSATIASAVERNPLVVDLTVDSAAIAETAMFRGVGQNATRTASWGPALGAGTAGGRSLDHATKTDFAARMGGFGWSLVRQLSPVFCVPVNADLLAYWDRIADRLYKIRNCMDIDGQKRELALFAPPIDPMQLVAMKAAGLSLDDVLGAGNGNLPPYRFLYLIDRAKAFAASLSGFGGALLSALEKRDGEQLNRLRLTQQMNLARQTRQIRQLEIQVASESLAAVTRQQEAAQVRSDYYSELIDQERNAWEIMESVARHGASGVYLVESIIQYAGAVAALAPQVGSPLAMKYGGVELHGSLSGFAAGANAAAKGAQAIASSSALEANFTRRRRDWRHHRELADKDIKSLDRQIKAGEIRLDIANRALDLHEKSLDQLQEFLDLTDGKFTSHGLYTWMAGQLQRLYRGAYQNALGLAKVAEQAYRFERGDDTSLPLAMSHWDPTHAGLLAGEQLLVDLQTLERRFLETNYRALEVDQAFALSQIDAKALVDLRETGECTFKIDEVFFDLFYPGHYKRRIKAVRLTLPCITGPYVNVSASLTLDASWIRPTATAEPVEVPPSRSVSIATSTAQNDGGVFELSFRDERYMPFEGLGAVSQWRLVLPKAFRQFDYQTINDVILSISYTAEQDGTLRELVETNNRDLEGTLVSLLSKTSARRLFSLRQDFSSAFTRLLRSPAGTSVKLELTERNFPLFVRTRTIEVQRGVLLLRTASGLAPAGFSLTLDGTAVTGFTADPTLGHLPGKALPGGFTSKLFGSHTLAVASAGNLAPAAPAPGDVSAVDAEKLHDVLVYLEYRLA